MNARCFLILLGLAALCGCKGTEDHLADLHNAVDEEGRLNVEIFDAGQLIHEALTGLIDADVLTLSQMGRATHAAGVIVEGNEVPLARGEAVTLLAHLALRYPIPPVEEPYDASRKVRDAALEQLQVLGDVASEMSIGPAMIPALGSPDRAVAEAARRELVDVVGEDLGPEAGAWEDWWAANEARITAEATARSLEPLRILGSLRYRSLSQARAVLGFVASSVAVYDLPELRPELTRTILVTARQVVVKAIETGLADPDKSVRMDAALAASRVLDPDLAEPMVRALQREHDRDAQGQIMRALSAYPSKGTVHALIQAVADRDRQVALNAARVLADITGESFGQDAQGWNLWWEREGKTRWP